MCLGHTSLLRTLCRASSALRGTHRSGTCPRCSRFPSRRSARRLCIRRRRLGRRSSFRHRSGSTRTWASRGKSFHCTTPCNTRCWGCMARSSPPGHQGCSSGGYCPGSASCPACTCCSGRRRHRTGPRRRARDSRSRSRPRCKSADCLMRRRSWRSACTPSRCRRRVTHRSPRGSSMTASLLSGSIRALQLATGADQTTRGLASPRGSVRQSLVSASTQDAGS